MPQKGVSSRAYVNHCKPVVQCWFGKPASSPEVLRVRLREGAMRPPGVQPEAVYVVQGTAVHLLAFPWFASPRALMPTRRRGPQKGRRTRISSAGRAVWEICDKSPCTSWRTSLSIRHHRSTICLIVACNCAIVPNMVRPAISDIWYDSARGWGSFSFLASNLVCPSFQWQIHVATIIAFAIRGEV